MKRNFDAEVHYDREALLYKGDAWELRWKHKITFSEYFDFCDFIVHNGDLDKLKSEYEKLLALANSRGSVDGK